MRPASSTLRLLSCTAVLLISCRGKAVDVHGGLSAQQILNRTAAKYSHATSYDDSALVDRGGNWFVKVLSALHDGGSGDRFTTHLDRGGACRFQYTRPNGQTFTVVGDDRQGAASTPYGPAQRFESWRSALGSIVGVTAASALPAVQLFLGESRSESVLELRDVERLPDDQIRGVRCAVIRGRTPRQRFTIWIGPDNRMLRVQHFIGSAKEPVADVRYTEVTIR